MLLKAAPSLPPRALPPAVAQAGHAVHEDEPQRTADAISTFLRRFRVGEPPVVLPRAPPGVPRALPIVAGPPCDPAA